MDTLTTDFNAIHNELHYRRKAFDNDYIINANPKDGNIEVTVKRRHAGIAFFLVEGVDPTLGDRYKISKQIIGAQATIRLIKINGARKVI